MKLSVILQKQQSLSVLASTQFDLKSAAAISHELAKITPFLEMASKSAMELYKKHGILSDDGARYDIPAENKDAFDADVAILNDTDIDLTLTPVNIYNVGKIHIAPAHVSHLVMLDGFILSNVCQFLGVAITPRLTLVDAPDQMTLASDA